MRVKTYDLSNRIIFVHSQSRDTIPLNYILFYMTENSVLPDYASNAVLLYLTESRPFYVLSVKITIKTLFHHNIMFHAIREKVFTLRTVCKWRRPYFSDQKCVVLYVSHLISRSPPCPLLYPSSIISPLPRQ